MTLALLALTAGCGEDRRRTLDLPPPAPAIQTHRDARTLEQIWSDLTAFLAERQPEVVASLRPPASDEQLDDLEALVGAELTDDYRALYRLADGQNPAANAPLFVEGFDFMPLDSVIDNWKMLDRIEKGSGPWSTPGSAQGPIWDRWFHPGWIPFARSIGGDHFCVDLAPAPGGERGQVVDVLHDDTPRRHLGYSLRDFLGEFEQGLREGRYVMHAEYGVFSRAR